jgi:hypothetical protein
MTQNYALGQFCMDSIYLPPDYWTLVDEAGGKAKEPLGGDDDGD